jgi:hypothetical protein
MVINMSIIHIDLHKPNNKLVSALLEHFWCTDEPWAYIDSPRPGLGGVTTFSVATPLLEECEDDTHTPEMGTWESSGTPETLKFYCKGQNTSA